jgi:hypothetical protein
MTIQQFEIMHFFQTLLDLRTLLMDMMHFISLLQGLIIQQQVITLFIIILLETTILPMESTLFLPTQQESIIRLQEQMLYH